MFNINLFTTFWIYGGVHDLLSLKLFLIHSCFTQFGMGGKIIIKNELLYAFNYITNYKQSMQCDGIIVAKYKCSFVMQSLKQKSDREFSF